MNTQVFCEILLTRKLRKEKVQNSIALVVRFEVYVQPIGWGNYRWTDTAGKARWQMCDYANVLFIPEG